jgi:hypothetical protein
MEIPPPPLAAESPRDACRLLFQFKRKMIAYFCATLALTVLRAIVFESGSVSASAPTGGVGQIETKGFASSRKSAQAFAGLLLSG